MSSNDRFIDELEDYLDEFDGETPLPVHVRDSVRAQLPGTAQNRSGTGPRRVLTMVSSLPAAARVGLVAAALVVAVGLGAAALANQPSAGVGGQPAASAEPSLSAQPTPNPSAVAGTGVMPLARVVGEPCYEGGPSCIPAGTYALNVNDLPGAITVEVPAGWFPYSPGPGSMGMLVDSGPDALGGSGWGTVLMTVGEVRRDPCDAEAGTFAPEDVDTPEELAAAMATWPGFATTEPEAITLDGVAGVQVQVSALEDIRACPAAVVWETALFTPIDGYPMVDGDPSTHGTFRIVDVDGELLVIRSTEFAQPSPFEVGQGVEPDPDRHAADLPEQQAIIDSIRFTALDPAP